MGLNAVFNQFDKRLDPRDEPYNIFAFRGRRALNFSTDYTFTYQNAHFFGETAYGNGGLATLNGLLLGVDKRLSFSLLQRFFSKKYQAINAQAFAESSRVNDENGLYLGAEFKPSRVLTVSGYVDFWQFNWLRFRADAPSRGSEYLLKTHLKWKNTEGYIQWRQKTKEENGERTKEMKTNVLVEKMRTQLRVQFNHKLSRAFELRQRLEWSFFDEPTNKSRGFLVWQDVLWKPSNYPLSISSRLAFFDTNDYSSAIYGFENDLIYNFTVLPYYGRGQRFYFNVSYKIYKKILLEMRIAQTRLAGTTGFSSGLNEIEGNRRTDVKCQLRWQF